MRETLDLTKTTFRRAGADKLSKLVSASTLIKQLGWTVGENTVLTWAKKGSMPCYLHPFGGNPKYLFDVEEVRASSVDTVEI